jgi:hypothetical protein
MKGTQQGKHKTGCYMSKTKLESLVVMIHLSISLAKPWQLNLAAVLASALAVDLAVISAGALPPW